MVLKARLWRSKGISSVYSGSGSRAAAVSAAKTSCSPPRRAAACACARSSCRPWSRCAAAVEEEEGGRCRGAARLTVVDRHVCAATVFRNPAFVATALPCLVGVEREVGEGGTRRCTRATRSAYVGHGGHLHPHARRCEHSHPNCTMSSPLTDVWEAAAASPFQPTIGKESQFTLGFALLFACMFLNVQATRSGSRANTAPALLLTGFFGLSTSTPPTTTHRTAPHRARAHAYTPADRSLVNVPLVGAPASIAFGYAPRQHDCTIVC